MNEGSKRFRIIFSNMEEQYQQQKRAVRRKRIDSSLPNVRKYYFSLYIILFL